jgi:hypothetical protein
MIKCITNEHVKNGETYLVKASHNVVKDGNTYITKYGPMKGTNYADLFCLIQRQVALARKNEGIKIGRTLHSLSKQTYEVFIRDRAIFDKYFGQLVKDYGLTVEYHEETAYLYGEPSEYKWHILHFSNK